MIEAASQVRQRLDIVQACQDLIGQFPENIYLDFVYWEHGSPDDGEPEQAKAVRLIPHLRLCDIVGLEVGDVGLKLPNPDVDVPALFERTNYHFRYGSKLFLQKYGVTSQVHHRAFVLGEQLRASGIKRVPTFVPLDVFDIKGKLPADFTNATFNVRAYLGHSAATMSIREETAIRQLHTQAREIAADGQEHHIGIVYGANHSLLSVATQALGAQTTRAFVDKPYITPTEYAERMLRFSTNDGEREEIIQKTEHALYFANRVVLFARDAGLIVPSEKLAHSSPEIVALNKLGLLAMSVDRMPLQESIKFDKNAQAVINHRKLSGFRNRGSDRLQAVKELLGQADRVGLRALRS